MNDKKQLSSRSICHCRLTLIANRYRPTSLITAWENSLGKVGVSNLGILWLESKTFSFSINAIHPESNVYVNAQRVEKMHIVDSYFNIREMGNVRMPIQGEINSSENPCRCFPIETALKQKIISDLTQFFVSHFRHGLLANLRQHSIDTSK